MEVSGAECAPSVNVSVIQNCRTWSALNDERMVSVNNVIGFPSSAGFTNVVESIDEEIWMKAISHSHPEV